MRKRFALQSNKNQSALIQSYRKKNQPEIENIIRKNKNRFARAIGEGGGAIKLTSVS